MYSVLVFLFTLAEVAITGISYVMHSQIVFTNAVWYCSPLYMIIHLLGHDSAFFEKNPIYIGVAVFHVIKYFCFFRSQFIEDSNPLRTIAIVFEALYLGVSAYYSI